jgi:uncharacterized protein
MIKGVGLGYRREMVEHNHELANSHVGFIEVAPENWLKMNRAYQQPLQDISQKMPLSTHGLSLSIGSPDPLDIDFIKQVKVFLKDFNVQHYTEHLSYCSADGHMYDLLPIPFTEEAVKHVSERIRIVQDILEQPIAIENVSYYLSPSNDLNEIEFTRAVLSESQCRLLLDVNNVYVNSINHRYNAADFISAMPTDAILYGHIAGHYDEAEDLKVDTHGSPVIDPVWDLLAHAYKTHGVFPTLLERDFNIPSISELLKETQIIADMQAKYGAYCMNVEKIEENNS